MILNTTSGRTHCGVPWRPSKKGAYFIVNSAPTPSSTSFSKFKTNIIYFLRSTRTNFGCARPLNVVIRSLIREMAGKHPTSYVYEVCAFNSCEDPVYSPPYLTFGVFWHSKMDLGPYSATGVGFTAKEAKAAASRELLLHLKTIVSTVLNATIPHRDHAKLAAILAKGRRSNTPIYLEDYE